MVDGHFNGKIPETGFGHFATWDTHELAASTSSVQRDQVKHALEKKPMGVGEYFAYTGFTAGYPVLIVPGFKWSSLAITKSKEAAQWQGKRAWIDTGCLDLKNGDAEEDAGATKEDVINSPQSSDGAAAGKTLSPSKGLGVVIQERTMKTAKAVQAVAARKIQDIQDGGVDRLLSEQLDGPDNDAGHGSDDEHDGTHQTCRGQWIRHLVPGNEGWKDPRGIEVRAIDTDAGLDGVTDLATEDGPCPFARLVEMLEMVGYQRGASLRAMPYDWRIPPKRLEERDCYFTRFKASLEEMVEGTGMPAVIVSHCLGGRIVHYFLNWVVNVYKGQEGFDGKSWVEKHIYAFIPLGGPFLGVPERARRVISGDDLGLGSMLTFDQTLRIGRGLGSQYFLSPQAAMLDGTSLTSFFHMQDSSRVLIRLKCMEGCLSDTIVSRGGFFLTLKLDKKRLRTRTLVASNQDRLELDDASAPNLFQFCSEIHHMQGTLSIGLCSGALEDPKDLWKNALFQDCVMKLSEFDLQEGQPMSITAPLTLRDEFSKGQIHPIMLIMEVTYEPPSVTGGRIETRLDQALLNAGFATSSDHDPRAAAKGVTAVPPKGPGLGSELLSTKEACSESSMTQKPFSLEARSGFMGMDKRAGIGYSPRTQEEMMILDDMDAEYASWQRNYRGDPGYGINGLAAAAPVVPRVLAIYGINSPTEVGAAYRYRNHYHNPGKVNTGLVLDTEAALKHDCGYTIHKGIIRETKATKQRVADTGKILAVSGDGTVPYASLRHCKTWESSGVDVRCAEITGCTHEGILSSPNAHQLLLQCVCTKPALYILIKSMTVNCEDDVQAQHMDFKGEQYFIEITFKGKTFRTEMKGGSSTNLRFDKRQFGFGVSQAEMDTEDTPRCYATLCKGNILTKPVENIGLNKAMRAMGFRNPNAGGRTKVGVASLNAWHDGIRPTARRVTHAFLSCTDGSPLGISVTLDLEAVLRAPSKNDDS